MPLQQKKHMCRLGVMVLLSAVSGQGSAYGMVTLAVTAGVSCPVALRLLMVPRLLASENSTLLLLLQIT
jgi:hypothetical protein